MFASGFAKPINQVTFDDISSICQMVRIHSSVLPVKAELDQIKEGLSLFSVAGFISQSPSMLKELFVSRVQPLALSLTNFLELIEYKYSSIGLNMREREESTTMHWNELLIEVDNKMAGMAIE